MGAKENLVDPFAWPDDIKNFLILLLVLLIIGILIINRQKVIFVLTGDEELHFDPRLMLWRLMNCCGMCDCLPDCGWCLCCARWCGIHSYRVKVDNIVLGNLPIFGDTDVYMDVIGGLYPKQVTEVVEGAPRRVMQFNGSFILAVRDSDYDDPIRFVVNKIGFGRIGSESLCECSIRQSKLLEWARTTKGGSWYNSWKRERVGRTLRIQMNITDYRTIGKTKLRPWLLMSVTEASDIKKAGFIVEGFHTSVVQTTGQPNNADNLSAFESQPGETRFTYPQLEVEQGMWGGILGSHPAERQTVVRTPFGNWRQFRTRYELMDSAGEPMREGGNQDSLFYQESVSLFSGRFVSRCWCCCVLMFIILSVSRICFYSCFLQYKKLLILDQHNATFPVDQSTRSWVLDRCGMKTDIQFIMQHDIQDGLNAIPGIDADLFVKAGSKHGAPNITQTTPPPSGLSANEMIARDETINPSSSRCKTAYKDVLDLCVNMPTGAHRPRLMHDMLKSAAFIPCYNFRWFPVCGIGHRMGLWGTGFYTAFLIWLVANIIIWKCCHGITECVYWAHKWIAPEESRPQPQEAPKNDQPRSSPSGGWCSGGASQDEELSPRNKQSTRTLHR